MTIAASPLSWLRNLLTRQPALVAVDPATLLDPMQALESALRIAQAWPADLRAMAKHLPALSPGWQTFPPEYNSATDAPYGWAARPDDWTAELTTGVDDPEGALSTPWPSVHIGRFGPVALAEARHAHAVWQTLCDGPDAAGNGPQEREAALEAQLGPRRHHYSAYSDIAPPQGVKAAQVITFGSTHPESSDTIKHLMARLDQAFETVLITHLGRHSHAIHAQGWRGAGGPSAIEGWLELHRHEGISHQGRTVADLSISLYASLPPAAA